MYLTYFDDTGGTGQNYSDPQQPVQGLCSVSIDETKWQSVEHSCRKIVAKYFPNEEETFLVSGSFEFHAAKIYQGNGLFRKRAFDERLQILYDIVDIIVSHRLPVTGAYIEKARAQGLLDYFDGVDNLDDLLFAILYSLLNHAISSSRGTRYTILIGDNDSVNPAQAAIYEQMFKTPENPDLHVLESVRFVDSHRSFGVQLADTAAFLVRRHLTHPQQSNPASDHLLRWLNSEVIEDHLGIIQVRGGWVLKE